MEVDGLYESVNYEHQFSRMYDARLAELRPYIVSSARAVDGTRVLDSILDAKAKSSGGEYVIIGTLFIVSDLKSSIFDKMDGRSRNVRDVGSRTYYSQDIKYFLEDSSGRIELEFRDMEEIYRRHFVISTGMCVGTRGTFTDRGKFLVSDVVFPSTYARECVESSRDRRGTGKVCFMSGVEIDTENTNRARLMVIIDHLRTLGVEEYIVIGSIFAQAASIGPALFSDLDDVFGYTGTKVTLIPDINDFGARVLPLTPTHPKLFKSEISSVFNPCRLALCGSKAMVTTSFVVRDLLRYLPQNTGHVQHGFSEYKMHVDETMLGDYRPEDMEDVGSNTTDAMATLLSASHICPTAPDTIMSAPFVDRDPFVITERLDYFCIGNSSRFASRRHPESGTLLFTVPSFARSHEVVVLDTGSGDLDIVKFDMEGF